MSNKVEYKILDIESMSLTCRTEYVVRSQLVVLYVNNRASKIFVFENVNNIPKSILENKTAWFRKDCPINNRSIVGT
jgi:hypothetical protein